MHHSHPDHPQYALHMKLDEIIRLLRIVIKGERIIMADLSTLESAVQSNTDVEQSAIALINGIAAQLAAAATDPAKVKALADQLAANSASLAAAVTANTPAATP